MQLSENSLQQLSSREHPQLIQGVFANTSGHIWSAFHSLCLKRRAGDPGARVRLYLEHQINGGYHFSELFDPTPFLPRAEHQSFAEYISFLRSSLHGQRFGLVVNDLHRFHFDLWKSAQGFIKKVYSRLGQPTGGVSLDLFLGDYHRTPFGIHKDDQDVFTWVIEGNKRFHLWPFERLSSRPELASSPENLRLKGAKLSTNEDEYKHLLEESIVLDARPRDLMYWPASYWHCADNPAGDIALTIAPGVVFEGDLLSAQIQNAWSENIPAQTRPFSGEGRLPSRELQKSLRAIARSHNIQAMQQTFAKISLATYTGSSFFSVPDAAEVEVVSDDDILASDPASPICWSALSAEEWVISANGHATCLSAPRALLKRLERMLHQVIAAPVTSLITLTNNQQRAPREACSLSLSRGGRSICCPGTEAPAREKHGADPSSEYFSQSQDKSLCPCVPCFGIYSEAYRVISSLSWNTRPIILLSPSRFFLY
jgi:50S ribosomal protein L16 3-hydroxylase